MIKRFLRLAIFVCALSPATSWAAVQDSAGVEQKRVESEFEKKEIERKLSQTDEAPIVEATERAAEEKATSQEEPFFVSKIQVTGATRLDTAEIESVIIPWQEKNISLSQAKEIAEELTQIYIAKGHLTSRAYIPPQNMDAGVLEIKVLEGVLGEVQATGFKYSKQESVLRDIQKMQGEVIAYPKLLNEIGKMNLHPDRNVKAILRPGQQMGASDLLLEAEDQFPFHVGTEVNNYGTRATGRERYTVSARHNNVTANDDILTLRYQTGKRVTAVSTQYSRPIGEWDTKVGAGFNYTDVSIGGEFADLRLGGTAYAYSVFANQPFLDTERLDLTAGARLDSKSIENEALDITTSQDELRMLRVSLTADETDIFGRTFIVNELTFGVPWMGASDKNDPKLSREASGASFFKYNGDLTRVHPIYDHTLLFLRASGQLTRDALVSAEQMAIGGVYSVRGYPQSDYLGDSGGGGSAEIRVPFYFIPREYKLPKMEAPLWNRCHFITFFDGAYAFVNKGSVGEDRSKTDFGFGAGLRFDFEKITASFEWATPVGDPSSESTNTQFYFIINFNIF